MASESRINGRRQAMTEDAAERRRYALLQAAATIVTSYGPMDERDMRFAVEQAEGLLAEIERREEAERER